MALPTAPFKKKKTLKKVLAKKVLPFPKKIYKLSQKSKILQHELKCVYNKIKWLMRLVRIPGFCVMKHSGVFLHSLPSGWDASQYYCKVTPA